MSRMIPESAAEMICKMRATERELAAAMRNTEAALGVTGRKVFLELEAAVNGESRSRQLLFSHLLAHGVKRKAAERIVYGEL